MKTELETARGQLNDALTRPVQELAAAPVVKTMESLLASDKIALFRKIGDLPDAVEKQEVKAFVDFIESGKASVEEGPSGEILIKNVDTKQIIAKEYPNGNSHTDLSLVDGSGNPIKEFRFRNDKIEKTEEPICDGKYKLTKRYPNSQDNIISHMEVKDLDGNDVETVGPSSSMQGIYKFTDCKQGNTTEFDSTGKSFRIITRGGKVSSFPDMDENLKIQSGKGNINEYSNILCNYWYLLGKM